MGGTFVSRAKPFGPVDVLLPRRENNVTARMSVGYVFARLYRYIRFVRQNEHAIFVFLEKVGSYRTEPST